jgi:hypothetical protein
MDVGSMDVGSMDVGSMDVGAVRPGTVRARWPGRLHGILALPGFTGRGGDPLGRHDSGHNR